MNALGNSQNRIIQGNCLGAMTIASMFEGKLEVAKQTDGVILISPVSNFSLPLKIKFTYFLPRWLSDFVVRYLADPVMNSISPGEDSEHARSSAIDRLLRLDVDAALRQVKEIFWKEDVSNYWNSIDVPALIYVGHHDPVVKYKHSIHPFEQLKYPIWMELEASDHFLLEPNIERIN